MSMDPAKLIEQALALHQSGQLKQAAPLYDRALAARPKDAPLLGLAGALQLQLGKQLLAVKLLNRALALRPDHAEASHNLGVALLQLERHAEAGEAFAAVTRLEPAHAGAWLGLGHALRARGQADSAMAAYRRVLALQPDHATALGVLGSLLDQAGAPSEAEPLLLRAVEVQPGQASLHNSLGLVFRHLRRFPAAEASFRAALGLEPDYAAALTNLAELLLHRRRAPEAIGLLAAAVEARIPGRRPPSAAMLGMLLGARSMICDWQGREALLARMLAAGGEAPDPCDILYHPIPPDRLRRLAEALSTSHRRAPLSAPLIRAAPPDAAGPIRIGYLSADFHEHATAYLIAEALERHDRGRFHVTAYSAGPDDGSAMRRRLRAGVDAFHDVAALSDRALVERIAADGLDILVDLKGWTEESRLLAMAWRPAPVQVTWLGYPGTLGADWIDYAIVDPVIAPPGAEAHFTEKLVRLPDCYQPNDRERRMGGALDRAAAGLPPSGLVLACFCQPMKIGPEVFGIWMRALAAVPDAVLWLLEAGPEATENLRREAASRGIDPARLVFAPKLPLDRHLARYRLADLALDTHPYGSHTTASDALWAGCPQLALTGDSFAARVSTSLVTAMGLPELAANGLAAHEAMLLRLCRDAAARAGLRAKLAALRDTAPLFDTPRFLRGLEAGYLAMIGRHRAGLPPASITIPGEA